MAAVAFVWNESMVWYKG